MFSSTDIALLGALKAAGVNLNGFIDGTGYTEALLQDPTALQAAQGLVSIVEQVPSEEKSNSAVDVQTAALKKYEHYTGVPNINWTYGWVSADLTIQGLKGAGPHPTRATFLNAIRNLKGYNANGLLPNELNLSLKDFGVSGNKFCVYAVQVKGSGFALVNNGNKVCGNVLPTVG